MSEQLRPKRNIFASLTSNVSSPASCSSNTNSMISSQSSSRSSFASASIWSQYDIEQSMEEGNVLECTSSDQTIFDDLIYSKLEKSIYDALEREGIRMADPRELQYNYYQRIRSSLFDSNLATIPPNRATSFGNLSSLCSQTAIEEQSQIPTIPSINKPIEEPACYLPEFDLSNNSILANRSFRSKLTLSLHPESA